MIANHILKTGTLTISGCANPDYKNNRLADYAFGTFFVQEGLRTGANTVRAAINSQTVLERTPSVQTSDFGTFYSGDGDFYSETGSFNQLTFPENMFGNWALRSMYYDIRSGKQGAVGVSNNTGTLETLFVNDMMTQFGSKSSMQFVDCFLNGQKIYTGTSGSYSYIASVSGFKYLENITGQLFAMPKDSGIYETTGLATDLAGVRFVDKRSNLYLNGMEAPPSYWLELDTGVTMISTGVSAKLFETADTTLFLDL